MMVKVWIEGIFVQGFNAEVYRWCLEIPAPPAKLDPDEQIEEFDNRIYEMLKAEQNRIGTLTDYRYAIMADSDQLPPTFND